MLVGKKLKILRLERNYFVRPIEENRKKGQQALMDYLRSDRMIALIEATYDRNLEYCIFYSREGGDQNAEPSADRRKEREKKRQVTRPVQA